jgi:ligand-binding sensor domain-containing protein
MAQYKVPQMFTWRTHLPYHTNNTVAQHANLIYVGSNSGVFVYDTEENSIEVWSKVTGLSDVEVTKLAYDEQTQTLVIVYKNTNVDLMHQGRVYNIRNILTQSIIGDKAVNDVLIHNGYAYLACSFGVVKIDLAAKQIVDSYQNIGPGGSTLPISDLAVFNNNLYASSVEGLFRASLNSGNLSDFNFWFQQRTDTITHVLSAQGYLLAATTNGVLRYDGLTWDSLTGLDGSAPRNVSLTQNKVMVIQASRVVTYDNNFTPNPYPIFGVTDGVLTNKGYHSLAIVEQGLVTFDPQQTIYAFPQGPTGTTATKFAYSDKKKQLFVAGGSIDGLGGASGWKPSGNKSKYYIFDGTDWYNGSRSTSPFVANKTDFVDVSCDASGRAYMTSFGGGLLEITDLNPTNFYDTSNSKLGYFVNEFPTYRPVFAAGTAVDEKGNVWVTSYGAAKPLAVKTPNNQWYSFGMNGANNSVGYIVCDNNPVRNNKWIINTRGVGLIVYNEGANIASEGDDLVKVLSKEKGNGALPSNNVLCMALDNNGEMWIGTDAGLCIISDPTAVFSNDSRRSYDARQLIFNTGSFNSIFLGTDAIYCIKVDGANRKWIGTRNGVWLVSEDGYTVIRNFTAENSPLLSNIVYDISIFEETGEVFFATEKGIVSYAGDATKADDKHGKVVVYPNPVRPEYTGEITIRGLATKTNVKVTDIAGNLVYETQSNGGTATWSGRNFNGKRVATGVYLIYSSNDDATETYVTKILVVN